MKTKGQIISIILLIIAFTYSVHACSCNAKTETVDIEFKNSPNVLVLTLSNVEILPEKATTGADVRRSTLTVERVFKGFLKVGDKVMFTREYSRCGWNFSEESLGEKFLFYLDNPDKKSAWTLPFCSSRSGYLDRVAADLLFLENLEKVRNETRLSGSVEQFVREMTAQGMKEQLNYLSGRKIRIVGNGKKIELSSNENGVYEIYGLPPGKYRLTPEKINGYSFTNDGGDTLDVEIKAKSHKEENIFYSINNGVRGKLYDANGKGLKNVRVELVPANEDFPLFHIAEGSTDEKGNFGFSRIPIGTFLIVVNKDGKISADQPFETIYYPGSAIRAEASEINIGAGVFFENLVIKAPKTAEVIKISGTVLFDDGNPAANTYVKFLAETEEPEEGNAYREISVTDEMGRFAINIVSGQHGKLFGEFFTFKGEFENCPQFERLLAKNKFTIANTSSIQILAIENLDGIELRFPFASCSKKRNLL